MSSRNRKAGNNYELEKAKQLQPLFPDIITTRLGSRYLDSQKVDLMNTGRYQFQCKLTQAIPQIRLLDQMPAGKRNVIIWGKTAKVSKYIVRQGEYAILKWNDFVEILNERHEP
jgi:hypothetical protein